MTMKEKILIGLFVTAIFIKFLGPIYDVDFPFHLKTGEYIYQHKEIPKDDPFSVYGEGVSTDRERFTLSQYWLAQVLFYKLYTLFGPPGIITLRAVIFTSLVFLLWFSIRKRGIYSSLLIVTLITINLLPYRLDRPQFFSFLFTLILILLFERFREKPNSGIVLFFIPPLMLLWSNMHAGFVFGLVVILIYTISEALKYFIKKLKTNFPIGQSLSDKSVLMLLVSGLLAILFSYVNPDTNGQLLATIESHTTAKWLYYGVREYMSPVQETEFPYVVKIANISFWILFGFICSITALNVVRKKSIDISILALLVFSSVAALTSVRYIPFFVIVAIPLSRDYRFIKDSTFFRPLTGTPLAFIVFSIFFSITTVFGLITGYKNMFTIAKNDFYPEKAADFLLKNHIEAKMFNSNNRGSYLIWKLYPHYRVFQDTRYINLEATSESITIRNALHDYKQTADLALGSALSALVPVEMGKIKISAVGLPEDSKNEKPLWIKLLEKNNIELIVHEATGDFTGEIFPLTLRLLKDDDWVLIYIDGIFQIFVKNNDKFSDIIKKYKKPKELIYDEIILHIQALLLR
jgi:hypothetical protein